MYFYKNYLKKSAIFVRIFTLFYYENLLFGLIDLKNLFSETHDG